MSTSTQKSMRRRWLTALAVLFLALVVAIAWRAGSSNPAPREAERGQTSADRPSESNVPTSRPAPSDVEADSATEGSAGVSGANSPRAPITQLPPIGTNGRSKVWVHSKFGQGEDQLGYTPLAPDADGAARAPQGFTITPSGELLVLDSEKKRLVWYDAEARIKRKLPLEGLLLPADVAVAADGTIAVMDHEGTHTKGTLLLTPGGERKGTLPQSGGGSIVELYAVGNDILGSQGGSSIKLGDTSGVPSHEMPGVYQQGDIPGQVAPDGRTVLDAGIESRAEGRFSLTVIRDDPPKHLYTRQYIVPVKDELFGISFLQADSAGTIYIELDYDDYRSMVLCLDGATGDPLGSVMLAKDDPTPPETFKRFAINREQGGLVYHRMLDGAASYEIYDCR